MPYCPPGCCCFATTWSRSSRNRTTTQSSSRNMSKSRIWRQFTTGSWLWTALIVEHSLVIHIFLWIFESALKESSEPVWSTRVEKPSLPQTGSYQQTVSGQHFGCLKNLLTDLLFVCLLVGRPTSLSETTVHTVQSGRVSWSCRRPVYFLGCGHPAHLQGTIW